MERHSTKFSTEDLIEGCYNFCHCYRTHSKILQNGSKPTNIVHSMGIMGVSLRERSKNKDSFNESKFNPASIS